MADIKDEPHQGIWQRILSETTTSEAVSIDGRSLLVLGGRNCGKTTLLSVLKQYDLHKDAKGLALDYTFLEVKDDDEILTRINVWQLEGEKEHDSLLKFALNGENIHKSVCIITLDFSQPWNLADELQQWIALLSNHIKSLNLPSSTKDNCRREVNQKFYSYKEPEPGKKMGKKIVGSRKIESSVEDLPTQDNETLAENLGIPILVVCCKSDSIPTLMRNYNFTEDDFEYIQQHLRRICLRYGASLIYTSAREKNSPNCELVREYVEHLLFHFDFVHQPQFVDKESLFVPIGWDSVDKIELDFANQSSCSVPNTAFSEVIFKPSTIAKQESTPDLITAEPDQEFLTREKSTLELKDQVKKKKDAKAPQTVSTASPAPATPTPVKTPKETLERKATRELLEQFSPSKPLSTEGRATPDIGTPVKKESDSGVADEAASFFQKLLGNKS